MTERSKPKTRAKEQPGFYDIPERYEIINGVRYDFLSSPRFNHQKLLANFHVGFHTACHLDGEVILAPMDVHFDEENIVQPDLIYIANANRGIIRDGFVFGVPDLLVEILSGSTARKDKTVKKAMFERFGVKEYWLADPSYRTVDQFVLIDGTYHLTATLTDEDRIASPNIPCLSIDLKAVFPPEEHSE